MKNPLKRNPAAAIEKAQRELALVGMTLTQQRADRAQKISDDAEIHEIQELDRSIVQNENAAAILRDKIAALQLQHADEQRQYRQRRYEQAIAALEAKLPERFHAAEEFESSLKAVAVAARKFRDVSARIDWPDDVPLPLGASPWFHLNKNRMSEYLRACFQPPGVLLHHMTRREVEASEYIARALNADKQATGFAAEVKDCNAECVAQLREYSAPEPEPEDEITEQEAAA